MNNKKQSLGQSISLAVLVIGLVASYLFTTHVLNVEGFWGGLLFLWFFGLNDTDVSKLPEIIIGGLIGIGIALFMSVSPFTGAANIIVSVCIILTVITMLVGEYMPLAFNQATALTLTVFTFHDLSSTDQILSGCLGFVVGAAYFGIIAMIMNYFSKKKESKTAKA